MTCNSSAHTIIPWKQLKSRFLISATSPSFSCLSLSLSFFLFDRRWYMRHFEGSSLYLPILPLRTLASLQSGSLNRRKKVPPKDNFKGYSATFIFLPDPWLPPKIQWGQCWLHIIRHILFEQIIQMYLYFVASCRYNAGRTGAIIKSVRVKSIWSEVV